MLVFENVTELNLAQTLDCGQSFRWTENSDGSFSGVAFGQSVTVRMDGGRLLLAGAEESDRERWRRYFDLETDYAAIRADISARHPVLREEPYETLCTFIISQNNNIKRIKGIVQRLCECCGKRLADGSYAFPDADVMSRLSAEDLAPLRAGFRTRYLLDAAKKVSAGDVDLDMCYTAPYEEARAELMKITGVGVKVADCTLLFGMHRTEAFPLDVWMKRAMKNLFPGMAPEDFGACAGIAQQYIFHYCRMHPKIS